MVMFPPSVFSTFCLFGDGEMSVGRFPPAQCVEGFLQLSVFKAPGGSVGRAG